MPNTIDQIKSISAKFLQGKLAILTVVLTVIFPIAAAIASLKMEQFAVATIITALLFWIIASFANSEVRPKEKKALRWISLFMTAPVVMAIGVLFYRRSHQPPPKNISAFCLQVRDVSSTFSTLDKIANQKESILRVPRDLSVRARGDLEKLTHLANVAKDDLFIQNSEALRNSWTAADEVPQLTPASLKLRGESFDAIGRLILACQKKKALGKVEKWGWDNWSFQMATGKPPAPQEACEDVLALHRRLLALSKSYRQYARLDLRGLDSNEIESLGFLIVAVGHDGSHLVDERLRIKVANFYISFKKSFWLPQDMKKVLIEVTRACP